jgi:hypothetical protein
VFASFRPAQSGPQHTKRKAPAFLQEQNPFQFSPFVCIYFSKGNASAPDGKDAVANSPKPRFSVMLNISSATIIHNRLGFGYELKDAIGVVRAHAGFPKDVLWAFSRKLIADAECFFFAAKQDNHFNLQVQKAASFGGLRFAERAALIFSGLIAVVIEAALHLTIALGVLPSALVVDLIYVALPLSVARAPQAAGLPLHDDLPVPVALLADVVVRVAIHEAAA